MHCGVCGRDCECVIETGQLESEFWGRMRRDELTAVVSDCCGGWVYEDGDEPITIGDLE